jgi:hypothetical protein
MNQKIQLGDRVKDIVTGFTGIAIGRTEWLNGCARITVQPEKLTKENKIADTGCFDEPQLVLIKAKQVPLGSRDTGGPIPPQQRRQDVTR